MNVKKSCMLLLAVSVIGQADSAFADEPDFLVEKIRSDGKGWVLTDYFYKSANSTPRTSRVVVEYSDDSYGKGVEPGPTVEAAVRGLFGFWAQSQRSMSACQWNGTNRQIWGDGWVSKTVYPPLGDNVLTIDYIAGKATWTDEVEIPAPSVDAAIPYGIFTRNYDGQGGDVSIYDLREFKVYETSDNGETETLVRDFVPCCANGEPAIYDREGKKIIYPTTAGFTIPMTNVTVAAGKRLRISSGDYAPLSLTLGAGSLLAFDGTHVLSPETEVVLPADGIVTVSLEKNTGRGRYVLIENLPQGCQLSAFALGELPLGCTGVLELEGRKLVLTVSSSRTWPDAIGGTLTSDAHGHVDTGYKYRCSAFPKTARVVLDFCTTNKAVGSAEGPHRETTNTRALFGYLDATHKLSYAKWTGDGVAQIWGGSFKLGRPSTKTGDDAIDVNYLAGTYSWGMTVDATLEACNLDADYSYWLFDNSYRAPTYGSSPSVYDLKRFRIYETNDGTTQTLAHDFVPCVSDGEPALYDCIAATVAKPESDTNGFVCAGADWRVRVNGETIFCASGSDRSFSCGVGGEPDGCVVLDEYRSRILTRTAGSSVSFTMPSAPVSVKWTHDVVLAPGEEKDLTGLEFCHDLMIGAGATLNFARDAAFLISGTLTLPSDGTVSVAYDGVSTPGSYVLIRGITGAVDFSKFVLVKRTDGLAGSFLKVDDCLVLCLVEDADDGSSGLRPMSVTSDGVGYVDTGYFYKGTGDTTTSRLRMDFSVENLGRVPGSSDASRHSMLGYLVDGTSISYFDMMTGGSSVFHVWHGSKAHSWPTAWNSGCWNGRQVLERDYAGGTAVWGSQSSTIELYASDVDATKSYYIFNCNGNESPAHLSFYGLDVYERTGGGQESLARHYVPALKNGRVGIYETVTKAFCWPTTTGFVADFGVITQRFAIATTISTQPVVLPAFAPQDRYEFSADGSFVAAEDLVSVTVTTYDAGGNVVGTETRSPVPSFAEVPVALNGAVRAEVRAVSAEAHEFAQGYEVADVLGGSLSLMRQTGKRAYEMMIAADAVLTFKLEVASVCADSYDADGNKTGSTSLCGRKIPGQTLEVSVGDADSLVLRIALPAPGYLLSVR